jgi:hypothetical protein
LSSVLNSKEDVDKHLPGVISGMFTHILNSRYWITWVLILWMLMIILQAWGNGFDGTKLLMASLSMHMDITRSVSMPTMPWRWFKRHTSRGES